MEPVHLPHLAFHEHKISFTTSECMLRQGSTSRARGMCVRATIPAVAPVSDGRVGSGKGRVSLCMQEAARIEKENARTVAEAEAKHTATAEAVRKRNAAAAEAAQVEWERECDAARDAHERLAVVIQAEFDSENEKKRRLNEELTVQRREEWARAGEAARREWLEVCEEARAAYEAALSEAQEHNLRIQPQVCVHSFL